MVSSNFGKSQTARCHREGSRRGRAKQLQNLRPKQTGTMVRALIGQRDCSQTGISGSNSDNSKNEYTLSCIQLEPCAIHTDHIGVEHVGIPKIRHIVVIVVTEEWIIQPDKCNTVRFGRQH